MGKGSSAPATSTVEQSNLPSYAEPYFTELLERASEQSLTPYTPYGGERLAPVGPDTAAAYDLTREIAGQGIAGLPQAMGTVSGAMQGSMDIAGQASPYQYDPTQLFTGDNVGQYMSPYMQQVVDVQAAQARRQYDEQAGARATRAAQAGAFGGSRQAVQEGMAERELLNRMADIQATGQQNAFQSAQQAFQADRAALFGREQAQAAEDASAMGRQLQALGQGAGLAGQMAALGETGRATDIQNAQLLEAMGGQLEGRQQEAMDMAYQDFLRQQAYPEQQLQLYSSILRGVPVEPTTTSTLYQPYNPMQQALGAGLGAIGLYRGLSA